MNSASIVAASFLAIGAAAAESSEVRVRSGDHPGFSRLVLEFPERPDWDARVEDGRATISFEPEEWVFQTATVFDFIGRSRIRGVSQTTSGALVVDLACECQVDLFPIRRGALVIDVKDGSAPVALRNVIMTSGEAEAGPETSPVAPVVPESPAMPLPVDFWRLELPSTPSPDVAPAAREGMALPQAVAEAGEAPRALEVDSVERDPAIDGFTRSLAEEIGRAASSGLLRSARPPQDDPAGGRGPPPLPETGGLPGVRFRSPGEDAGLESSHAASPALSQTTCPANQVFDVASWIPAQTSPADAVASARQRLYGELDRTDEDAALALARLYVALGFGAEALAVLQLILPVHPDAGLLSEIARIIDETGAAADMLRDLRDCPGRPQLWSSLASPDEPVVASGDVLVAFAELPLHLRRLLGPRLYANLAAHGERTSAETVRQLVDRAPGPHGVSVDLWQASEAAKDGERKGVRMLEELASGASPVSAEALVSYLELMLQSGYPAETALVELGQARARELRDTRLGDRLSRALTRTHLVRGEFEAARARLQAMEDFAATPFGGGLRDEFLSTLARDGDDGEFLRHGTGLVATGDPGITPETALIAATRMAQLGFGQVADDYLRIAKNGEERDILAAKIALEENDMEAALQLLGGLEGEAVDGLRAEILSRTGRHAEAADFFERLGDPSRAEASIWLSGDWDRIVELSDPTRAQAARLLSDQDQPPAGSPVDLVARSEEARARLENLLGTIAAP